MNDFNPVQWGQFLEKVASLTEKLTEAEEKIDGLTKRLDAVENRYQLGKAGLVGIVFGVGFALNGLRDTLQKIADWITK